MPIFQILFLWACDGDFNAPIAEVHYGGAPERGGREDLDAEFLTPRCGDRDANLLQKRASEKVLKCVRGLLRGEKTSQNQIFVHVLQTNINT